MEGRLAWSADESHDLSSGSGVADAIGVDVGGTKIAAGLVNGEGAITHRLSFATPSGDSVTNAIREAAEALVEHGPVRAVGVSVAGFVTAGSGTVTFSPNIPGWAPTDLGEVLAEAVGLPVVVENDANCAAWAETVFGAGAGSTNLVCLTVGTGLGGGIVLNRQLYRGSSGFAAELGHMTVVPGGRECPCGKFGCWERYASGTALLQAYEEGSNGSDPIAPGGSSMRGGAITRAAAAGNPAALAAFSSVGAFLGTGMADLTAILDVDTFVVGGGVAEAGDLLLQPTRLAYEAALPLVQQRLAANIVSARLGNLAGVVGAADLARIATS